MAKSRVDCDSRNLFPDTEEIWTHIKVVLNRLSFQGQYLPEPTCVSRLGKGSFNTVFKIEFAEESWLIAGNREVALRINHACDEYLDLEDEEDMMIVMTNCREYLAEIAMQLALSSTDLAPKLYYWDATSSNEFGRPFVIMELLFGRNAAQALPLMNDVEQRMVIDDLVESFERPLSAISFSTVGRIKASPQMPAVGWAEELGTDDVWALCEFVSFGADDSDAHVSSKSLSSQTQKLLSDVTDVLISNKLTGLYSYLDALRNVQADLIEVETLAQDGNDSSECRLRHGDLAPRNIMVEQSDGVCHVKVLDWGTSARILPTWCAFQNPVEYCISTSVSTGDATSASTNRSPSCCSESMNPFKQRYEMCMQTLPSHERQTNAATSQAHSLWQYGFQSLQRLYPRVKKEDLLRTQLIMDFLDVLENGLMDWEVQGRCRDFCAAWKEYLTFAKQGLRTKLEVGH
ncbi:hypothetical protein G7Y79_00002g008190 [Physcia stellaris]|nr:hypothetical protein G7Y79_00002g008190 [Physcia stellaris]